MNDAFDGECCRPNGFGFCQQHQTCDHVTASLREAQVRAEEARSRLRHLLSIEQAVCATGGSYGPCKTHPTCEMVRDRLKLAEAGALYLQLFAERVSKSGVRALAAEAKGLLEALLHDGNLRTDADSQQQRASSPVLTLLAMKRREQDAKERLESGLIRLAERCEHYSSEDIRSDIADLLNCTVQELPSR